MTQFEKPTNITDAERRILDLSQSIREIAAQLGNRNRTSENGKRMSDHEYYAWRRRAITAKVYKESEQAYIKQWIREQNRKVTELIACEKFHFDKDDPVSLLAMAYRMLRELRDSGFQMTKEEVAMMDVIRDCLRGAM